MIKRDRSRTYTLDELERIAHGEEGKSFIEDEVSIGRINRIDGLSGILDVGFIYQAENTLWTTEVTQDFNLLERGEITLLPFITKVVKTNPNFLVQEQRYLRAVLTGIFSQEQLKADLEGMIGGGKSDFLELTGAHTGCERNPTDPARGMLICEKLQSTELEVFYNNMAVYAFPLQFHLTETRFLQKVEVVSVGDGAGPIVAPLKRACISDRSFYGEGIFSLMFSEDPSMPEYTPERHTLVMNNIGAKLDIAGHPDLMIVVETDPFTAAHRVLLRKRAYEQQGQEPPEKKREKLDQTRERFKQLVEKNAPGQLESYLAQEANVVLNEQTSRGVNVPYLAALRTGYRTNLIPIMAQLGGKQTYLKVAYNYFARDSLDDICTYLRALKMSVFIHLRKKGFTVFEYIPMEVDGEVHNCCVVVPPKEQGRKPYYIVPPEEYRLEDYFPKLESIVKPQPI